MTYAERIKELAEMFRSADLNEYQTALVSELFQVNIEEQKRAISAIFEGLKGGDIKPDRAGMH